MCFFKLFAKVLRRGSFFRELTAGKGSGSAQRAYFVVNALVGNKKSPSG
jgi:hypothetical protein